MDLQFHLTVLLLQVKPPVAGRKLNGYCMRTAKQAACSRIEFILCTSNVITHFYAANEQRKPRARKTKTAGYFEKCILLQQQPVLSVRGAILSRRTNNAVCEKKKTSSARNFREKVSELCYFVLMYLFSFRNRWQFHVKVIGSRFAALIALLAFSRCTICGSVLF